MDNFIVSARKYRPKTFDTVVGQKAITTTLKNAISKNHLAQAFLFCGPRGVGKTTCARVLAKTINCQNIGENTEACNKCQSCTTFDQSRSFNIHELDAASNNTIDDIKSLIEQVRFAPQIGKYSIYIIDEVHMLSSSAFNAFLKTLEEPPAHAIFILATTEKHKIIPTILSRCQIFDFSRIEVNDIAAQLSFVASKEGVNADSDAMHIIAQKADGSLRDALSIFDQLVSFAGDRITYQTTIENLNILDYDYYFKTTSRVLENNIHSLLVLFNDIISQGFDGRNFINGLAEHFRNLMVCRNASTLVLLQVGDNIRDKYREQSLLCTDELLLRSLEIVSKCDLQYGISRSPRLHVELAMMQLCSIGKKNESQEQHKNIIPPDKITAAKPAPASYAKQSVYSHDHAEKVKEQESQYKAKTISISEFTGKETRNKPEEKKNITEEKLSDICDNEPDEENLHKAWNNYALILKEKGKHNLHSTFINKKPWISGNNIELAVDNTVQEDEIKAEKPYLISFLRKELNCTNFNIIVSVNTTGSEKKPYTQKEKFERMVQKNPALEKLKQQLDLDI